MKKHLYLDFNDLKIANHLWPKYDCFTWTLKAILEFYGFKDVDLILGKQWGFIYEPCGGSVFTTYTPLQKELLYFHNVNIFKRQAKDSDKALAIAVDRLKNNHPIIFSVCVYYLPYHYSYKEQLAPDHKKRVEDELRRLENGELTDRTVHYGGHIAIITGYDEEKELFHVTDLYIHNRPPFRGWISRKDLTGAIDSYFLEQSRNTWYEIEFDDQSFKFDVKMILDVIILNIYFMLKKTENSGRFFYGINGIRMLAKDIDNWATLAEDPLKQREKQLFDDLYWVILQRDAHIGFLKAAEKIIQINFKPIIDILEYNYHIFIEVRPILFKGSTKNPYEIIPKVKPRILEIADNEEKALQQIGKLIEDKKC